MMTIAMEKRMFFVIGSPRSGTTMLMRMLNMHSEIHTRPEPHLFTPLAHLGYYDHVDKAPYDPFQAAQSVREFVADLPNGEADYIQALQNYTDHLYGSMLAPTGKQYFLDKTPAYALVLPFIRKVYPNAVYVFLTRHPFAIFSSFAKSFFDGDWQAAHDFNPIVERYVPAIADGIRNPPARSVHVKYEELVANPDQELQRICQVAGIAYDPEMVHYGQKKVEGKGLGDPIGVKGDNKPNTRSIHKWAQEVAEAPERRALLETMLVPIQSEDLAQWGTSRDALWEPLIDIDPALAQKAKRKAKKWDRHHIKRRALLVIRRNIHHNWFGRILKKIRYYLNILLRE